MAKKEDILSAEQQINDILESLSKMKKAADMLENAQKNTDEIVSSSKELVKQMDIEGFGNCSNTGACEVECPKGISLENIAILNREFLKGSITD